MPSLPLRFAAVIAFIALSNGALADDCYVSGDTSNNNLSKPLGSKQNPYGSLASVQADTGCDTIIVAYSGLVLDGGITLTDRQTLKGRRGPRQTLPIISNTSGANGGHGVQLAADNTVDGLHITDVQNSGVFGGDVGDLEIRSSLITDFARSEGTVPLPGPLPAPVTRAGIEVSAYGDAKIRITDTDVGEANSTPVAILVLEGSADVVIENVTARDQGVTTGIPGALSPRGISVLSFGTSSVDLKVQNSSVSNIGAGSCGCDGLLFLAFEGSSMSVLIDGYSYLNPDGDGGRAAAGIELGVFFGTGASFEGTVKNSHIEGSTGAGIQVIDQGSGSSNQVIALVRDNEVHDSRTGIQLFLGNGSANGTSMMTIDNNLVVNPSEIGIDFINAFGQQMVVDLLIQRNTVMNALVGLFFEQGAGGSVASLNLDAGLGGLGSQGKNRIIGSQTADLVVRAVDCCSAPPTPPFTVDAANNWWGSDAGPATVIQHNGATVDFTPFLTEDPED